MSGQAFTSFDDVPRGLYQVIVADPPWEQIQRTEAGYDKSPQAHYRCASVADMGAWPVRRFAASECALIMWALAPMLPHALDLMQRWGFRFVTSAAWAKASETGAKWAFGTGHVLRGACEFILIGAVGHPKRLSKSVRNLIAPPTPADLVRGVPDAPCWPDEAIDAVMGGAGLVDRRTRIHSEKPDSLYRWIETLYAGPYLDLCSRQARGSGWDCAGDQAGSLDAFRRDGGRA